MSSPVVILGTMFIGLCFLLDVVGVATDFWFVVGSDTFHSGLFKVCFLSFCEFYTKYDDTFLNIHFLGTTACCSLGCLLMFVATVVGFCGCSAQYAKPVVQNIGGIGLSGGVLGTVGFIWYYLYFFTDVLYKGQVFSLTGLGHPGFSFYLSASASGLALIVALILVIAGCNMPVNGGVVQPQHQMIAVQNQQQQSFPAPSAPPNNQMFY